MEDFVRTHVEREGHVDFFHERRTIWDFTIENARMGLLCKSLSQHYRQLQMKWKGKKDALLHCLIEWDRWLSAYQDSHLVNFCMENAFNLVHMRVIIRAMGKYVVAFLKQPHQPKTLTAAKKSVRRATKRINKQPPVGIKVLASATIGCMFRLFKRNRSKYCQQFSILKLFLVDKQTESKTIPVQLKSRDEGGLYIIKDVYLPVIEDLDSSIYEEFQLGNQHGKELIKVGNFTA